MEVVQMQASTCLILNMGLCSFNAVEYYNTGIPTFGGLAFLCGIGVVLSLHELVRGGS